MIQSIKYKIISVLNLLHYYKQLLFIGTMNLDAENTGINRMNVMCKYKQTKLQLLFTTMSEKLKENKAWMMRFIKESCAEGVKNWHNFMKGTKMIRIKVTLNNTHETVSQKPRSQSQQGLGFASDEHNKRLDKAYIN